jgi:hypothetical protein
MQKKTKFLMKIHTCLWMFAVSKNIARTFGKKSIGQPMDLKNLWKIYSLSYGFSFFVISISAFTFLHFFPEPSSS